MIAHNWKSLKQFRLSRIWPKLAYKEENLEIFDDDIVSLINNSFNAFYYHGYTSNHVI